MKFLIDAQLPRRLAARLVELGHDAIHTLDLPSKNRTSDAEIIEITIREQRILITKDSEFVDSFLLYRQPYKLLLVSTGNIKNSELDVLFLENLDQIVESFRDHEFVELDRKTLTVHV